MFEEVTFSKVQWIYIACLFSQLYGLVSVVSDIIWGKKIA